MKSGTEHAERLREKLRLVASDTNRRAGCGGERAREKKKRGAKGGGRRRER